MDGFSINHANIGSSCRVCIYFNGGITCRSHLESLQISGDSRGLAERTAGAEVLATVNPIFVFPGRILQNSFQGAPLPLIGGIIIIPTALIESRFF